MKKALGPVTLAYPMPAFLVAAYDEEGKANIMTAAWGGICCSNPPCIAVSVRPERWTHKAIVAGTPYRILGERCDECGNCHHACPVGAVIEKGVS